MNLGKDGTGQEGLLNQPMWGFIEVRGKPLGKEEATELFERNLVRMFGVPESERAGWGKYAAGTGGMYRTIWVRKDRKSPCGYRVRSGGDEPWGKKDKDGYDLLFMNFFKK